MARILIVDDDPTLCHVLAQAFKDDGHQVVLAGDGKAGVGLARDQQPDLVIMDLQMPTLAGVDAIRQLKTDPRTMDIRVIAMSGGTTLRAQADDLLADCVLGKPFDLDELMSEVTVQLRQRTHSSDGASGRPSGAFA